MGAPAPGGADPPGARRQLAEALAAAALDPDSKARVPWEYALDLLAQRYHIAPWELEEAPDGAWISAGLLFMRLEGEAQVKRGDRRG